MSVIRKPPVRLENLLRMEKISIIVSHILVALMMSCIGLTVMQVAFRLAPGLNLGYYPWLCLLIAIESMYTRRTTRRTADMDANPLTYIFIEALLLLIVIKLFIYIWEGFSQIFIDVPQWTHNFLGVFFNSEYLIALLVSSAVWGISGFIATQLFEMEGDERLINPETVGGVTSDRGAVRGRIMTLIFAIGFMLVAIVSLMYIELQYRPSTGIDPRLGLAAVLAYFFMGMALLSQTQFSVLRASWAWERLNVDPVMLKRWTVYSLVFLLLICALAFILPTGYSMGLLATLQYVIQLAIVAFYALLFILTLPLFWILSLFNRGGQGEEPVQPMQPPQFPKVAQNTSAPIPWLEFLKSVLFWVIFLAVIGYAISQYLKQNQELTQKLRKIKIFNWLAGAWKWFWGTLRGWNEGIATVVQAGITRLRARSRAVQVDLARRFVNLRRLPPRERVMFFYLAMVRRSGEQGLPRHPYQTPKEFAQVLQRGLPEAGEDVEALTGAFEEARYSRHEISHGQAGDIRRVWERIKRALRLRPRS